MAQNRCQPIRESIQKLEQDIREAQDLLPELLGPVKKVVQEFIKRETDHLKRLRAALRACESTK